MMDCNKEEAVRAKGIAEMKMQNRDFQMARKMAVRAQQLCPNLESISQLVMVCDVHCTAEKKFGNEMDWYGILQVQQSADEATIKKQYRKFALLLHPDKNKFAGAEAAFKLIGEAQRILLDQNLRSNHDMKRNASLRRPGSQSLHFSKSPEPFRPPHGANWNSNVGMQNNSRSNFSGVNAQHQPAQQATQADFFNGHQTFWTACAFCGMKYQFYTNILNKPLTCQSCKKNFVAYNISVSGASQAAFSQQGASAKEVKVEVGSNPTSTLGNNKPECLAKTRKTIFRSRKVNGRVRRSKENFSESDSLNTGNTTDSEDESAMSEDGESKDNESNKCSTERAVRRSTRQRQRVSYKESASDEDDIVNPRKRSKGSGESHHMGHGSQEEAKPKRGDCVATDHAVQDYPDPQFSDFGKDRREECFAVGQVWAAYDTVDYMPRFYALIKRVNSPGCNLKITWFEPYADEGDGINWIRAGLPVAAGNFKFGKTECTDNIGMFSHEVIWDKGRGKGPHKVFPMVGETWALFKNWDIKWSFDVTRKYEYEIVEVLSQYNEENGTEVAYLGKVNGFVSLFSRTFRESLDVFRIPTNELYRFSHRIPSFKLTGDEGKGIPVGSFELDPASVPKTFFKTVLPEEMKRQLGSEGCSDHCDLKSGESSSVPQSVASNGSHVPEPEFYNFDDAKSPQNFKAGQVWALYSDEDGLPKYYGLMTEVTTVPKLELQLLWLASDSLPKGAIGWRDKKMLIPCGRFKIDKSDPVCYGKTDYFSHRLNVLSWEKDGTCTIFPGKGEVWALYKNWDSGIKQSDSGNCDYNVVEVIDTDGSVITVVMLERVCGFGCVFRPQGQGSSRVTLRIPLAEILRFSNQIPAFRLTEEKDGSLRGFWEVDPLALPARFFAPN